MNRTCLLLALFLIGTFPSFASQTIEVTEQQALGSFYPLPRDVTILILSQKNLSVADIFRCGRVSKRFRNIAESEKVWAGRLPPHSVEMTTLFLKQCPMVRAIYEEVFKTPLYQAIPASLSIKMTHRLYAILQKQRQSNNEELQLEIMWLVNSVHITFSQADRMAQMRAEILKEYLEEFVPNFSVSSRERLEEMLLFSEQYDGSEMESYLFEQTKPHLLATSELHSIEAKNAKLFLVRRIYNRFIKLGSQVAVSKRAKHDKLMSDLRIEFDPENNDSD